MVTISKRIHPYLAAHAAVEDACYRSRAGGRNTPPGLAAIEQEARNTLMTLRNAAGWLR